MKKEKILSTRVLVEVAIVSAICFVFDYLSTLIFKGLYPNGGSIGITMVPIFILCYRRGFIPSLIASMILAGLQMAGGIVVITSQWYNVMFQIILDYIIAYPLCTCACIFNKKLHNSDTNKDRIKFMIIGTTIGGLLKYVSHIMSGAIFWKNYDFPGGPFLYSVTYNATYMLPNIVIATIIMVIITYKAPQLMNLEKINKEETNNNQ